MRVTAAPAWRARLGNALALVGLLACVLALASLHRFEPPDARPLRAWTAALLATGYLAWIAMICWRGRAPSGQVDPDGSTWIVAYASQTGYALALAERSCDALRQGGAQAQLLPVEALTVSQLRQARVLFVVSTTGEGDAPDHALGMLPMLAGDGLDLACLRYAVLALGDRAYSQFCAFGRALDARLQQLRAKPLFDRVEVDNADDAALRHWQHHLSVLTGDTAQADWSSPDYQAWPLLARRQLNPGSPGAGAWLIELAPSPQAHWQAGDIAEIGPRHDPTQVEAWLARHRLSEQATPALRQALAGKQLPEACEDGHLASLTDSLPPLPHREYSIASLPADGCLQLLVRRMQQADGRLGLGSGWLTAHAAIGQDIAVRLRRNPGFHVPDDARPLILIGNGTGMAGLRALLREREARRAHRNWLLFGERTRQFDCFFEDELLRWQHGGHLARLDLAFSRDPPQRVYVQDKLRQAADELRNWVDEGAAIYVCGSLAGMAPAVDAELRAILGDAGLQQLRAQGRYRRDVY
ncbi:sulfite reductase subunit alpha [Pseudoxanthomonas composti]|uniref:NADPH--hemoprotein reductase n=1 Tax=Pseudoxanthomonas composti TaxID=2137479 RepID=A0A4Q1K0A0_9GAMM|nr:sulfite reductase subunit alpha [Pseudoxanthomonas composti]RXR08602.1 sulfite reductase flavoprotein subunit alpha [Pseudoxanthomonas composti]